MSLLSRSLSHLRSFPLRLCVASGNRVKVNAAHLAIKEALAGARSDVQGIAVESGVPDQPWGDAQTLQGACNRVGNLQALGHEGLLCAIEGGVGYCPAQTSLECFAWVMLMYTPTGQQAKARTASFTLPDSLHNLLLDGMELGDADDMVFGRSKSGQGSGTIGHLTGDRITRTDYYKHAVAMALVPLLNAEYVEAVDM